MWQVRNSSNSEFGLYSATKPTIEHSSELRFTCWMGAYPGLTQHFEKANLDPKSNQWDKVHSFGGPLDTCSVPVRRPWTVLRPP